MEKLVLIDGNSLINRAFYATPVLTTKSGVATNAVYAFMNMLVKIIEDINPKYITVAFDLKAPTFRHEMYVEYKGKRKPMPDALVPQIPLLKEVLDVLKINRVEKPGIEADDLIATIASSTEIETIIITGDKDSFQLVDNTTSIYFTRRGITDIDIYNVNNFYEKTGISPMQVIELKALMGDASDNIPGVSGVGEKTALTLVQTYKDIDNLYKNIESINGKLKEKLILGKDSAFMSRTLATVKRDADINVDLSTMTYSYPFSKTTFEKFKELEFKSLLKRAEIFESIENVSVQEDFNIVTEIKEITEVSHFEQLLKADKFSVYFNDNIHLYTFDNYEYVIKIQQNLFSDGISYSQALSILSNAFSDKNKTIYLFNLKETMHLLKEYVKGFNANFEDVCLIKYLADYSGKDDDFNGIIESEFLDKLKPATNVFVLFSKYNKLLNETNMYNLYKQVELPLTFVLYDMENQGFRIDERVLNEISNKLSSELKEIELKIYDTVGEKFNINSPKQLSVILFEKLKLNHGKKRNGSYSTNAEVLEELSDSHEVIPLILQYRKKQKLLSTYVLAFVPLIEKSTGLIHTSFNQVVTSTGRLSSKKPNLQNIPIRDDEGKEIRKMFIARDENHVLVGADYSQIELRLMAHFSNSKKLIDAFNNNLDIHSVTASEVFNVPFEKVTSQMRRKAKAVNFGIIYGISNFGLAQNLKIFPNEAGEYIKAYFNKYPEVKTCMNNFVDKAEKTGYAETLLGRRRYIRELNSANYQLKEFGKRVAMNMPLQGSSADIIKVAMINVSNRLSRENLKSKLILQIHDELIIDALKTEVEQVKQILIEEMGNAVQLKVKLSVDTEIGERWFDAK